MKTINCIAVDDEPIALSILSEFCKRFGNFKLTTFSDPKIGLREVIQRKPDLVFLDIEMDSINGLEFAQTLPKDCCFIFTTAYTQYALDGFNLDAVDYLCKPFAYERFEIAVERALRRIKSTLKEIDTIVVKQDYAHISIPIDDILYLEAMENYTKIYRKSTRYAMPHQSLKAFIDVLPENRFIQIHRSFIVHVDAVDKFCKRKITLTNGTEIPVGRQFASIINRFI